MPMSNGYELAGELRKYASSFEMTYTQVKGWEKLRELLNEAADKLVSLELTTEDYDRE